MQIQNQKARWDAARIRRRMFGASVWMMMGSPAVGLLAWSAHPGVLAVFAGLVTFCVGACLYDATERPGGWSGAPTHASDPRIGMAFIAIALFMVAAVTRPMPWLSCAAR
jgi:hypothetical protein